MCTCVRIFVQFNFTVAQFLEDLGTILTKNQGLTREWLLIRARLWHPKVSHQIFSENKQCPGKFWKWGKIPSELTTNTLVPVRCIICERQWECMHSCGKCMVCICTNAFAHTFAKCIRGFKVSTAMGIWNKNLFVIHFSFRSL